PATAADGTPATVEVMDGPPITDLPANYVLVGYNAAFAGQGFTGTSGLAIEGSRALSDLGNRQFGEVFTTWCEASTVGGDGDPGALSRQRRYTGQVVAAMWATIEADPTLGGVVQPPAFAAVGTFRWLLDRPEDGVAATCQFGVDIVGGLWVPR